MEISLNKSIQKKRLARILATQYLFPKISPENTIKFETSSLLEILEEKKFDKTLYEFIVDGVEENIEKIDKIIEKVAPEWPLNILNPVDLTILRISIFEGYISKSIPPKVAINEALEIDKAFNGENSSSFINGVLGQVLKEQL